jgi:Asp-tRNA(Asn)/Glu-tRNA(Gln) amidotransferase A subunit family amidase
MTLTLASYIAKVQSGEISPRETLLAYLEKAELDNARYNAYITISRDYALEHIDEQATV